MITKDRRRLEISDGHNRRVTAQNQLSIHVLPSAPKVQGSRLYVDPHLNCYIVKTEFTVCVLKSQPKTDIVVDLVERVAETTNPNAF